MRIDYRTPVYTVHTSWRKKGGKINVSYRGKKGTTIRHREGWGNINVCTVSYREGRVSKASHERKGLGEYQYSTILYIIGTENAIL